MDANKRSYQYYDDKARDDLKYTSNKKERVQFHLNCVPRANPCCAFCEIDERMKFTRPVPFDF